MSTNTTTNWYWFDTFLRSIFLLCELFYSVSKPKKRLKKRLLLVRFDAIGDCVIWLDALQGFEILYPKDKFDITLVCDAECKDIFVTNDYFDKIVAIDRQLFNRSKWYRTKIFAEIWRSRFDLVINPMYSREFAYCDAIVRMAGSKKSIGFEGDLNNITAHERTVSNRWYTDLIRTPNKHSMELRRNAEFVRALGLQTFQASIQRMITRPLHQDRFPEVIEKNYYVLFPGSRRSIKKWPFDRFMQLAERIYAMTGWLCVLCGGESEKKWIWGGGKHPNIPVVSYIGKTSLNDLANLIGSARFVVTNDSSAAHIAEAVSTPAVCILGGFHPGRFLPYDPEVKTRIPKSKVVSKKWKCFGCNWNCIYPIGEHDPGPCISSISVDEVWKAVCQTIEEIKREES